MNNLPPNATLRYAGNLLRKGSNDTFVLIEIGREALLHDGLVLGFYYNATVKRGDSNNVTASGVTPVQAVRRALGKAGVTFRE